MVPRALQPQPGLAISQSSVVADKNFHENENPFQRTFTNIESFYMLEFVQRLIILGKIMLIKIFMQQFFGLGLARGIVFIEKSARNPYHLLNFISLFKPLWLSTNCGTSCLSLYSRVSILALFLPVQYIVSECTFYFDWCQLHERILKESKFQSDWLCSVRSKTEIFPIPSPEWHIYREKIIAFRKLSKI